MKKYNTPEAYAISLDIADIITNSNTLTQGTPEDEMVLPFTGFSN